MEIIEPSIRYFTAPDGYRFAIRVWENNQAKGYIVCLHGIISHGGWYLSSCSEWARAGFEVHFLDRRGSGLNESARGDVDRYETLLHDVESYLEKLPKPIPKILLGISWGGILATAVARHRPNLVDGLALICPGLFSRKPTHPIQRAFLKLAGTLGLKNIRVPIPLQDPKLFTHSPNFQKYIETDSLTLRKVTIRFALGNLQLSRYATSAPQEIQIPTLLLLAEGDPIIHNFHLKKFFEKIGSNDKKIIEYSGASHTLEFDPNPSYYFNDVVQWAKQLCF